MVEYKGQRLIDGVEIKELKVIKTFDINKKHNGWLIDILRDTDNVKIDGKNFSQIYMTTAFPRCVKGFHWHKTKVDHFCTTSGLTKLVLIDDRENSSTKGIVNEFIMGDDNFIVVRVPKLVKHAFKNIGETIAYILNYMTPGYDQNNPDNYDWEGDYKW